MTQACGQSLGAGKDKATDIPLQPPGRNTVLLTLYFRPVIFLLDFGPSKA